ncbi:MAG TPA: L,D-transpeptidase family protein [Pseudonocardiaceae bacterium]
MSTMRRVTIGLAVVALAVGLAVGTRTVLRAGTVAAPVAGAGPVAVAGTAGSDRPAEQQAATTAPATPEPTAVPTTEVPAVPPPVPVISRQTVAPTTPPPAAGAPCRATARACVDLSANRSWLLDGAGNVTYGPVPITHGRAGWLTPPGTFSVTFKNRHHKSSIFNDAPMPYSVFFNGGIAFHQGSLSELSHGCIHLSAGAASTFFGSLSVGDVVQVVP